MFYLLFSSYFKFVEHFGLFKSIPVAARLRRGSAAAPLLGMCVRIPPKTWMSVSLSVLCSASGLSLVQRSPTECGVSECHPETSIMRRVWPIRGCCAMKKCLVQYIKTMWPGK
jgi:hypothetical protein